MSIIVNPSEGVESGGFQIRIRSDDITFEVGDKVFIEGIELDPFAYDVNTVENIVFVPHFPARAPSSLFVTVPVEVIRGESVLAGAGVRYVAETISLNPASGGPEGGYPVVITTEGPICGPVPNNLTVIINGVQFSSGFVVDCDARTITFTSFPSGTGTVAVSVLIFEPSRQILGAANFTYGPIPCLAPNTKILMADGTEKEIQLIERGENVFGDLARTKVFRVSRVVTFAYDFHQQHTMVTFAPNSIIGNTDVLRMTGYHPVIFNGVRREARCFANVPGVNVGVQLVRSIMDPEETGNHCVYDLQFDFEGQYVAEGALLQSRSPCYRDDPLPKHLYFDQSCYTEQRTTGTLNHPYPMDNAPLVETRAPQPILDLRLTLIEQ